MRATGSFPPLNLKIAIRLSLLVCLSAQIVFYLAEYRSENVLSLSSSASRRMTEESYHAPNIIYSDMSFSVANVTAGAIHGEQQSRSKDRSKQESPKTPSQRLTSIWDVHIEELVNKGNYTAADCDPRLTYMDDVVVSSAWNRRIPMVVHVTGKTRCLSQPFLENLQRWKLKSHSFYFHDDDAVDQLLQAHYWPEFPQLQNMQHCMVSGAAKADLWRYLVLYRYGGIYADMDTAPGEDFFRKPDNTTTIISSNDDGFFVVERIGVLSQYFMATSPRHPLMFMAVQQAFSRLLDTNSIGEQYVPYVTGPGALKNAYIRFMGRTSGGKVTEGTYTSPNTNRSITVVGRRGNSDRYIQRESVMPIHKRQGYKLMGMTHFSRAGDPTLNVSCYEHLYHVANSPKNV